MSVILFILAFGLLFGIPAIIGVALATWSVLSKPSRTWGYARALLGALLILAAVALSVPGPPSAPAPVSGGSTYVLKGTGGEVVAAVRAFQKAKGLRVDGVIGPETCPLLYRKCPVL